MSDAEGRVAVLVDCDNLAVEPMAAASSNVSA